MRKGHRAGGSVGTPGEELPAGGFTGQGRACAGSSGGVLTLRLVPFDHAWTLGQDGFLE